MKNITSRSQLYAAATRMVAGLNLHAQALNLVHVTAAVFSATLDAARQKETAYGASRTGKRDAVAAQNTTRAMVDAWAAKSRDALRPYLGNVWSEAWVEAGFKAQSLSLPTTLADLVELVRSLKMYFTNHSNRENATVYATAAMATTHLGSLSAAIQAVANCKRDQRAKRDERDATETALLKLMRKVHGEVDVVIEAEDVRWLDFEDAAPGDEHVPEAIGALQAESDTAGELDAEWLPSARAARYHVEAMEAGRDAEFVRAVTVTEPNATLPGFTPGARVKVRVKAVNGAGESPPSDEVEVVVLAEAAA